MKAKKILVVLAIAIVLLSSVQLAFAAPISEINEVAREFICNCGCNKLLPNCDMVCGEKLRGVIAKKIDAGWNKQKIVDYMMKNYNEQILSAPTKKGFNLSAWVTPFIAIALGGMAISLVILAWMRSSGSSAAATIQESKPDINAEDKDKKKADEEYKKKMDEELKDFDW